MTTSAQLPALLTATEACDILRVSRSTLSRMVNRGDLRAVRVSHGLRIPSSALSALIDVSAPPSDDGLDGPDGTAAGALR
jgi:excisionase family DNA binding protein